MHNAFGEAVEFGRWESSVGEDGIGSAPCNTGEQLAVSLAAFEEQLARSGIDTSNRELAEHLFRAVGPLKLAPYVAAVSHPDVPAALRTVQVVYDLLEFDRDLRPVLMKAIDVVEAQVKSQFIQALYSELGEGCLDDPSNFKNQKEHRNVIAAMRREMALAYGERARWGFEQVSGRDSTCSSDQDADCDSDCKDSGRVPSRLCADLDVTVGADTASAVELAGLGSVSRLYGNVRSAAVAHAVAASFSANRRCFDSWLRAANSARNSLAHFAPYVVRAGARSFPKPVHGVNHDNAAPLYILHVLDRLLSGRALLAGAQAACDAERMRSEAVDVVGRFAWKYPELAVRLRFPYAFVAPYVDRLLPRVEFRVERRMARYCSVRLACT